jgi:hypothetical protein
MAVILFTQVAMSGTMPVWIAGVWIGFPVGRIKSTQAAGMAAGVVFVANAVGAAMGSHT